MYSVCFKKTEQHAAQALALRERLRCARETALRISALSFNYKLETTSYELSYLTPET